MATGKGPADAGRQSSETSRFLSLLYMVETTDLNVLGVASNEGPAKEGRASRQSSESSCFHLWRCGLHDCPHLGTTI